MEFNMDRWMADKRSGEVLIEYVGDVTSSYIDSVLPVMEQELHDKIEVDGVRKKAFHCFVECAQNLFHHIEPESGVEERFGCGRMGVIVMSKEGEQCRITTGNFIPKEKQPILQKQIDRINALDETELRSLYRETMNNKRFSEKGGAGIGMIDMARKSGNKLKCDFYTIKELPLLLFFSFDVFIS
ncbi:MAG: SiaB family protein kinase [Bacteroidales bacterium]|nr:SiaB family protein kinase [Bacteroidales bacterium]